MVFHWCRGYEREFTHNFRTLGFDAKTLKKTPPLVRSFNLYTFRGTWTFILNQDRLRGAGEAAPFKSRVCEVHVSVKFVG